MQTRRTVVGVNGSAASQAAAEWAVRQAAGRVGGVALFAVWSPIPPPAVPTAAPGTV